MHTVTLFVDNGTWMAKHSDPMIVELFETDTIPTAYTSNLPADKVARLIADKSPRYKVIVK